MVKYFFPLPVALLILFFVCFLSACQTAQTTPSPSTSMPPSPSQTESPPPSDTPFDGDSNHNSESTPPLDPIQAQIDAMSIEEKIGQLLIVGFPSTAPNKDVTTYLEDYHVGGFILFSRNLEDAQQTVTLNNQLKALNPSEIPLFLSVDQEGGWVDRTSSDIQDTPSAFAVGERNDPALVLAYGDVLGATCTTLGFNMNFAPCVDVWSNPQNTVIGRRALGTSFEMVASLAPYAVEGLAQWNVLPVIKHFPGHGDTALDSHKSLPVVHKTLETLYEEEFLPFQAVLETSYKTPVALMISHLLLPQIDEIYPATLSAPLIEGILRGEMGYDGLIVSDDMSMGAITNDYSVAEGSLLALQAGCDILLLCHKESDITATYHTLLDAVASGDLTQERIDASLTRILQIKSTLTDAPTPDPDLDALNQRIQALTFLLES